MQQKRVRCADCRFVRVDTTYCEDWVDRALLGDDWVDTSPEDDWIPYECGNCESEYFRSLVNVSVDGDKLDEIIWAGCEHGERKVA